MPTLCQLGEVDITRDLKTKLDGKDIWSQIASNEQDSVRLLYWKSPDAMAVRYGKWKLIEFEDKPAELYNISIDPYEKNNVANKKTFKSNGVQATT